MNSREILIILAFIFPPFFITLSLAISALTIAIMPREYTRALRRWLADLIMWQWKKGARLSAIVYGWLWQRGNGH